MGRRWVTILLAMGVMLAVVMPIDAADKGKAKEKAKAKAPEAAPVARKLGEGVEQPKSVVNLELKNRKRVYYGKVEGVTDADKIGLLEVRKVFPEIKHYKAMRRSGVPHGSARYWIYLAKANKVFKSGVRRIAMDMLLQVVTERGNITKIDDRPLGRSASEIAVREERMDITTPVVKTVRDMS